MDKKAFFEFISAEHLYFMAMVFTLMAAAIVFTTFLYLYLKKRKHFRLIKISETLNEWISEALLCDDGESIPIPDDLGTYLKKEKNRYFVIDSLIKIHKNLTGTASENIIKLYEELGLKKDSLKRMHSIPWHMKTRGIYELYMMEQRSEYPDIFKYTNSNNEYVRMEAQTAAVGFSGFGGLVFLNELTYPLHDWQQLKLLEQLSMLDVESMEQLPEWLQSPNRYVVIFALKLADIYQQFQVHDEVAKCLYSPIDRIRYHAIKTLGHIPETNTADILIERYSQETSANKREILVQLATIGSAASIPFLLQNIADTDATIKLEAARALVAQGNTGWEELNHEAEGNEVLTSIAKQIKYELSK